MCFSDLCSSERPNRDPGPVPEYQVVHVVWALHLETPTPTHFFAHTNLHSFLVRKYIPYGAYSFSIPPIWLERRDTGPIKPSRTKHGWAHYTFIDPNQARRRFGTSVRSVSPPPTRGTSLPSRGRWCEATLCSRTLSQHEAHLLGRGCCPSTPSCEKWVFLSFLFVCLRNTNNPHFRVRVSMLCARLIDGRNKSVIVRFCDCV